MSQLGSLGSNPFEDVIDERVHDAHGLWRYTGVGMNLLQHFVDIDGVRFLPFLAPLLGTIALRGFGLSGFLRTFTRDFGRHIAVWRVFFLSVVDVDTFNRRLKLMECHCLRALFIWSGALESPLQRHALSVIQTDKSWRAARAQLPRCPVYFKLKTCARRAQTIYSKAKYGEWENLVGTFCKLPNLCFSLLFSTICISPKGKTYKSLCLYFGKTYLSVKDSIKSGSQIFLVLAWIFQVFCPFFRRTYKIIKFTQEKVLIIENIISRI